MINMIFLGPPGAGKGTQSAYIVKDYGVVQISTGDMLRAEINKKSPLGATAAKYLNEGKLVPDYLIIDIMKHRLQEPDCAKGFILDGFPRTIAQADALDNMLKNELDTHITHIIALNVPDELIMDRITGRRSCPKCGAAYHITFNPPKVEGVCDVDGEALIQRSDDSRQTILKRLDVYHSTTALLKNLYGNRGVYSEVDGTKAPSEVYEDIKAILG